MKNILFAVVTLALLAGCASSNIVAPKSDPIPQAELVAQTGDTEIFRFVDIEPVNHGTHVCYVTENKTFHEAAGIWCTP